MDTPLKRRGKTSARYGANVVEIEQSVVKKARNGANEKRTQNAKNCQMLGVRGESAGRYLANF